MSSKHHKKQKAETAYGEVEYETVTCAFCDNTVVEERGVVVIVDPYEKECSGLSICEAKHPHAHHTGFLCEFCAESIFGYDRRGTVFDYWTPNEVPKSDIVWYGLIGLLGLTSGMLFAVLL